MSSIIIPTPHTEKERLAIITQNLLISQYFQKAFMLEKPSEMSRDRQGHIYALYINHDYIDAYTIGMNTKTKEIIPFHVGKLSFDTEYGRHETEIDLIGIHQAFMNKGLGTILLQTFENHIKSIGRKSVMLDSMRNYVDLSVPPKTISEIRRKMSKSEAEDYVLKNFYDSNLYLYTSMGYAKLGQGTQHAVIMKKENLQEMTVAYGLERPLSFKRSKKDFSVSLEFLSAVDQASVGAPKNFFRDSFNSVLSENFSPFVFNPTINDLDNFHKVAMAINANNALYTDRIERLINAKNYYDTKYSSLEKVAKAVKNDPKKINSKLKEFNDFYNTCISAFNQVTETESQPGEDE